MRFRQMLLLWLALCLSPMLMAAGSATGFANGFVVSTHPIFLIANAVTRGIEQPQLLLDRHQSGHDVQLSPQQIRLLKQANLVLWLGPQHEAPLRQLLSQQRSAVALLDSELLSTLPLRNQRAQYLPNGIDSHVWLDPNNAARIAFYIAVLRSQQNPSAKARYWQNAQQFSQKLFKASKQFEQSANAQPYWAYHDAYQYLERPLNLKLAGALTEDPHVPASATQLKFLNDNRPRPRMCLLAEGSTNAKQFAYLQPVTFQAVDESLSSAQDFVLAWQQLARQVRQCVQRSAL